MSLQFKRWTACALALAVFATVVSVCSADGKNKRPPMDPQGEPEGFHLRKGTTECFKVWHNPDGWHVHVVNGKGSRDHRYEGTISVEGGVIENIRSNVPKKTGLEAQWKHRTDRTEISFDFTTPEKEDGVSFKVSNAATAVRFSLKIDGKDVPDQILVGKRGDNPDSSSFSCAAHPGQKNPEQVTGGAKKTGNK